MNRTRTLLLGGAWTASLVIAATVGWAVAQHMPAPPNPVSGEHPAETQSQTSSGSGGFASESEQLRAENENLREHLEQIETERKALGRDYLQLALKQSFDSAGPNSVPREQIRARWDETMSKILSNRGEMFGNLEHTVNLAIEIASYGESGIRFMGDIANDRTKASQERETALQILSRIRHRSAFDFLVNFRDSELTELDYPYDLIRFQVASLPTAQIAGRLPDIVNQIAADLGGDNFSPERAEVLFYLAAIHHDARAQQLLRDERIWGENLQGAVAAAQNLHNAAARDFLQAVAQYHQDPGTRSRAANIVDNW